MTPTLRQRVVLVGMPGAPLRQIAEAVADQRSGTWCDTDDIIEQQAGKSASDIFVDDGEVAFRELERAAVRHVVTTRIDDVVVLGSGAVMDQSVRALLSEARNGRNIHVIYVDVAVGQAAKALGFGHGLTLQLNPRAQWLAWQQQRDPLYRDVASCVVEASGNVVGKICALLS